MFYIKNFKNCVNYSPEIRGRPWISTFCQLIVSQLLWLWHHYGVGERWNASDHPISYLMLQNNKFVYFTSLLKGFHSVHKSNIWQTCLSTNQHILFFWGMWHKNIIIIIKKNYTLILVAAHDWLFIALHAWVQISIVFVTKIFY